MASEQIEPPTYGTLDDLWEEMKKDIRVGRYPRIGHIGALGWFVVEYERRAERATPGGGEVE